MPKTMYARVGDTGTHVAYQVLGSGERDLVFAPPFISHLEALAEQPRWAAFLERLTSFSRVLTFDKRGTGMSDPAPASPGMPPLEQRMDEISAVMNAAGSSKATLLGTGEGASAISLFAATYPERVWSLILCNVLGRQTPTEDYPWGWGPRGWYEQEIDFNADWLDVNLFAPSHADDPAFVEWFHHMTRLAASPSVFKAIRNNLSQADIRSVLQVIRSPTLVIHRANNRAAVPENGRYVADRIPGSRFVLVPGADQWIWCGNTEPVLAEIQEFVTGARPAPEPDRVLATVLVTDIVGSTQQAAELGDRGWRELLEQHNKIVRRELQRWRGREIDTTGDGFIAAFDGPARSVECAWAIGRALETIGVRIRAGVHTGECQIAGGRLAGIAVNIAVRICAEAGAGDVVCSGTVKDLVIGSGIRFLERGSHHLKGIPGEWALYAAGG